MRHLTFFVLLAMTFGSFVLALGQDMDGNERAEMVYMLNLVSKEVEQNFYDPDLKGLDWRGLTAKAKERIVAAKMHDEAIVVVSSLVGELHDSHTRFVPPNRVSRPLFGFAAKMFGDEARIYEVKPGGAADKAGLQPGDRILQIFDYRVDRRSFDEAILHCFSIRSLPELQITYQRDAGAVQTVIVTARMKTGPMLEDSIPDEDAYRSALESGEKQKSFHGMLDDNIGFFQAPNFAPEEIGAVHTLKDPKAVVIDLRGNPGGRIDTVAELAGHFEPERAVLARLIGRKRTTLLKIKPHRPALDIPMVILVDSRTASAAEMFARYFQKKGRAQIIGDVSAGRVNDALYYPEKIGASHLLTFGLQISVALVVLEDGEVLEGHPLVPDYPCLPTESDLREHHDPCLKKAVALARKAIGRTEEVPATVDAQVERMVASILQYNGRQLKRPD